MANNHIDAISKAIEIIENNLEHSLNLDNLSKEVGLSKYHLLRIFKAITDKSLMSYLRSRRLSVSLTDLINTELNIIDLAVKYQFKYEQSYIRAFQSQFHITPAKYRRIKHEIPIEQKIDVSTLKSVSNGFIIQPKMIFRPPFYIQGIKEEIIHKENIAEFTTNKLAELFFYNYLPRIPNKMTENIYMAMVSYRPKPEVSNDYMPCVETSILNKAAEPFITCSIPLLEYAVFRYIGFHSPYNLTIIELQELYDYIMKYWQTHTTYKQSKPYHFEQMNLSICSETYCEMDIYIPINT